MSTTIDTKRLSRCIPMAVAAALVALSAPASANPPAPEAPQACTQFGFPGPYALKQSNGYGVSFNSFGASASGQAINSNSERRGFGTVTGLVSGRIVDFTIDWDGPSKGEYTGTVGDDGMVVNGTTFDAFSPASTATWNSVVPLNCLTVAAPTAAPKPAAPVTLEPRGDADGDGLFNEDETTVYRTNPRKADTDGDGSDDGQEVFDGTDPLNPNDS